MSLRRRIGPLTRNTSTRVSSLVVACYMAAGDAIIQEGANPPSGRFQLEDVPIPQGGERFRSFYPPHP